MNRNTILKLLAETYKYYPIGMPKFTHSFNGYKELLQIIEDKIVKLRENKTLEPWNSLVNHISKEVTHSRIHNENYYQFPNYVLRLELSKDTYREITTTKHLRVTFSLLVNYFTIYYQQEFVFHGFLHENQSEFPKKIILYGKKRCKNKEKQDLLLLQNIVTKYYSDYNFVPHNLLFSHEIIGGLPHGEDFETIKEKYTLYQYLFGHYYFLDITEILD